MITATSTEKDYLTEISGGEDGVHCTYADQPKEVGGGGEYMRPGQLLQSAYASCINITACKLLREKGLAYRNVTTSVDMQLNEDGTVNFYAKTVLDADIPAEIRTEILAKIKHCPVCKILAADKQFLELV